MYDIPTSIVIQGQSYAIRNRGDYRMVLDCFLALEDEELTKQERIVACLLIFYEDLNTLDDIDNHVDQLEDLTMSMFRWFNCNEPDNAPTVQKRTLVDWEQDSQLICSAINKVAGMEIRAAEYIHWWTFLGYYMAIGESLFSTVVSIRDKIIHGTKLEKHEREFRTKNPQYFVWNRQTVEERELDSLIRSMWNAGKEG